MLKEKGFDNTEDGKPYESGAQFRDGSNEKPDEKDYSRIKNLIDAPSNKIAAIIKSITDPNKLLRRTKVALELAPDSEVATMFFGCFV